MSKKTINSHYVPRLTLRQWSPKLCLFNIKTGDYKEDVKIEKAFCEKGFYSPEVEENLNKKIESLFGGLLNNTILKADSSIELSRDELLLIKKFLIISIIRSRTAKECCQFDKHIYENKKSPKEELNVVKTKIDQTYFNIHNLQHTLKMTTDEDYRDMIRNQINEQEKNISNYEKIYKEMESRYKDIGNECEKIKAPFEEKKIDGETDFDYWMRTINVILDTNGTPEEIYNHPEKTYPAYYWANVVNRGYIAFWDSEYTHDEFVITDIGMTSENEKGWDDIIACNMKKHQWLLQLMEETKNNNKFNDIISQMDFYNMGLFHENFMMFSISAKRMIVLINPFFKFRIEFDKLTESQYKIIPLDELTMLPNEKLFYPNTVDYVRKPNSLSFFSLLKLPKPHPDDKYIYDIKKLTSQETIYCNELFLDRINEWVGFSSLDKALKSIFSYAKDNQYPATPRVDYKKLYKIINEKYTDYHIDLDRIATPTRDTTRESLYINGFLE